MSNGTYETKEIELASFLKACDVNLTGVKRNDHNKLVFIFDNAGGAAEKRAMDFFTGNDMVSATKLFASFKMVKNLIFVHQRGGNA